MTTANRWAEVEAVDAFLAEAKTLDGPVPEWGDGSWGSEYQAIWNVRDSLGATVAQLRFTAQRTDASVASISLVYRSRRYGGLT